MLALNLAKIRSEREHVEGEYTPDQLTVAGEGFSVAAPVVLAFDVHRDKKTVHLAGRVVTTLELACSRCLEPFTRGIDQTFDLRYQPRELDGAAGDREIGGDDLSTSVYEDDEIDLGQLMLEQFHLSVPMKPLCRDDCRGLCPQCGTNLNRATCDCARGWEDPRFATLRALGTDMRESQG